MSNVKNLIMEKVYGRMRNKSDVSKMSDKKEDLNKMKEEKEVVSKFTDDNIKLIKDIIEDMKKIDSDVKLEDFKEYIKKLEGVIVIEKSNVNPDGKPVETPELKPDEVKPTETPEEIKPDETPVVDPEIKPDDKPKDAETPEVKPDDVKPAETPEDVPEDKASKHEEIQAYQKIAKEAVSKMKDINASLKMTMDEKQSLIKENSELKDRLSKFESTAHNDLVKGVVDELSKFKDLNEEQVKAKSDELSKMSDTALKIMKAEYSEFNVSKMGEEADPITVPSQSLTTDNAIKTAVSKMQDDEVMKTIKQKLNIRS